MNNLYNKMIVAVVCMASLLFQCTVLSAENEQKNIASSLDAFHQAAAEANFEQYFELLAPNAVFIGTDASERWTKASFAAFVEPYFSKGQGWLYTPTKRHITLLENNDVAFFDENLLSESYGETRGSGVLIKTNQGWKIAQYNLSIPMPNNIAKHLVKQIKAFRQKSE